MSTSIQRMTVEEFSKLPETGEFYYELRQGEPFKVTRPKLKHHLIQERLVELLRAAPGRGHVSMEMLVRALPEFDVRCADVAFMSPERWDAADPEDYFQGAPDLVIEVLSPSNTADEIYEKQELCLANGCLEFRIVNPKQRQVVVGTPDGKMNTYREGQEIPLGVLGGGALPVGSIFN